MKNGKRLTTLVMALALFAGLAVLIFAAPAAAESFTVSVTPTEVTGTQAMTLTISESWNPEAYAVGYRVERNGCTTPSEHSEGIAHGTYTITAPNERGWYVVCGYVWTCELKENIEGVKVCIAWWIIGEAQAEFQVTASTVELKEQKEAEAAKEAEAKAAKEAQEKWEREATEAKVAAEAKEAQERAARVEAETKAHEVQQAEREAIERAILNPAKTSTPASSAADEKLFCEDEPTALLPNGTRCPNTTPAQFTGKVIAPPTLTKAQKLTKALKQCKKLKKHSKRVACEKRAKKRYGSKPKRH